MPINKLGFVGAKYRPAGEALVRQLEPRHPVLLIREPTNPKDPNAIAVYVQIGYVPKAQAAQWASQIDTLTPRFTTAATMIVGRSIELVTPRDEPRLLIEQHSDTFRVEDDTL